MDGASVGARRVTSRAKGESEILIEFVVQGNSVKVTAIDAATGTEASIVGPASSPPAHSQFRRRAFAAVALRPSPIFLANSERCAA